MVNGAREGEQLREIYYTNGAGESRSLVVSEETVLLRGEGSLRGGLCLKNVAPDAMTAILSVAGVLLAAEGYTKVSDTDYAAVA